MHQLIDILEEATAKLPAAYFTIPIATGDPVYRERPYCYELYHQLRSQWPTGSDYVLTAELDKSAHPIIAQTTLRGVKPDFLVHKPGSMEGNDTVIEVKSQLATAEALREDIAKLREFRRILGYKRAILLLWGYDLDSAIRRVREALQGMPSAESPNVWVHRGPGQAAEQLI